MCVRMCMQTQAHEQACTRSLTCAHVHTQVGDALLDVIFDADQSDGAGLIVDGFPRTALQVDVLKMLYDKMMQLHLSNAGTLHEWRFPRPSFKVGHPVLLAIAWAGVLAVLTVPLVPPLVSYR